jgi:radical SAM superfamily enzyme YgiQ (UPF0313 family)
MKILLIWGPLRPEEIYGSLTESAPVLPPLELAYIASFLRGKGNNVKLIDAQALELSLEAVQNIVREEKPDIVGATTNSPIFSLIYSVYSRSLEVLSTVKNVDPGIKTFLCGYFPTLSPIEVLSRSEVDYAVIRNAEETVAEICDALKSGTGMDDIRGLAHKKNGQIIINPERHFPADLDFLPIPAFDLLPMEKYRIASDNPVPIKGISIRATRGCGFGCYFCSAPGFWKGNICSHSPEYILKMMNYIHEKYGYTRFQFHDDNFGRDKKWIMRFCELLKQNRKDFVWDCYERFDLIDAEMLTAMRESGCVMISLGVEAGDERLIKKAKGISLSTVHQGMALLKNSGIKTRLFFMIGPPAETAADIKNSIKLAIRLDPDVFIATVSIPYPGSRFYEDMRSAGYSPDFMNKLIPIYEAPFDFPNFSRDFLNKMIKQAYRSFYLRPGYIFKHWRKIFNHTDFQYFLKGLDFILK